jgi:hypothetical protein
MLSVVERYADDAKDEIMFLLMSSASADHCGKEPVDDDDLWNTAESDADTALERLAIYCSFSSTLSMLFREWLDLAFVCGQFPNADPFVSTGSEEEGRGFEKLVKSWNE